MIYGKQHNVGGNVNVIPAATPTASPFPRGTVIPMPHPHPFAGAGAAPPPQQPSYGAAPYLYQLQNHTQSQQQNLHPLPSSGVRTAPLPHQPSNEAALYLTQQQNYHYQQQMCQVPSSGLRVAPPPQQQFHGTTPCPSHHHPQQQRQQQLQQQRRRQQQQQHQYQASPAGVGSTMTSSSVTGSASTVSNLGQVAGSGGGATTISHAVQQGEHQQHQSSVGTRTPLGLNQSWSGLVCSGTVGRGSGGGGHAQPAPAGHDYDGEQPASLGSAGAASKIPLQQHGQVGDGASLPTGGRRFLFKGY